jgi:hypothetical protein
LSGYSTKVVVLAEDKKFDEHLTDARPSSDADAVLVAFLADASYVAAGATSDYLPFVSARVKLVSRDGKVLYEDLITYGYLLNRNAVHLDAPSEYRFKDIDALVASPDKTRSGLLIGVRTVAEQIARDLRR